MIAVSRDPPEELAKLAREQGFTFRLLSDPKFELIDAFGLRHVGAMGRSGDLARPTILFFDSEGRLADVFLPDTWRARITSEDALARVKATSPRRDD